MRNRISVFLQSVFAVILLMVYPSVGISQSIWILPSQGNSVSLEAFKADFTGGIDETFASSVWFLTGRYKPNTSITIVGELPLSHFDVKSIGVFDAASNNLVGNPYFGFLFNPENSRLIGEVGIRIPLSSDSKLGASVNGWYSEFDRWEAFIPDLLTVRGRLGAEVMSNSGNLLYRFLAGGTLWIPTESGETEVFADAVGQIWFQKDHYLLGATLSGRSLVSQSGSKIFERSEFQFGLGATGSFGNVRPGVHVHIPLGDEGLISVGSTVDAVFGLNVTLLLGQPR